MRCHPESSDPPRVAVIGGGLAGLAAAARAVEQGFRVEVFEARRRLGGRVGSLRDPDSGELIDHCQHVAMGCCTSLVDFCRRTGIADAFRRFGRLTFIAPDGKHYPVSAARWLPAPLHLLPGLMRLGYLSWAERWHIVRTMRRLARLGEAGTGESLTVHSWLREQGESARAIEQFWAVVLVSALGETLDRASLAAARKVFVDGFLTSRRDYELLIPQAPLGEIFDRRLGAWLAEHQVGVHLGTRVRAIEGDAARASAIILPDGSRRSFDYIVVAVPWYRIRALLPEAMLRALPSLDGVDQIPAAPITAVHLWFNRQITTLPHAALVGRLGQWLFRPLSLWERAAVKGASSAESTDYCQIVISGSHQLTGRPREEVIAEVCNELAAVWPAAGHARLLRGRVVTVPAAVFSMRPGVVRLRPPQQTPIPNLLLAGDWTATGWPATMEGAVRSGYRAAEVILRAVGR